MSRTPPSPMESQDDRDISAEGDRHSKRAKTSNTSRAAATGGANGHQSSKEHYGRRLVSKRMDDRESKDSFMPETASPAPPQDNAKRGGSPIRSAERVKVTIYFPVKVWESVEQMAREDGVTRTEFLRRAVSTEEFRRAVRDEGARIIVEQRGGQLEKVRFPY